VYFLFRCSPDPHSVLIRLRSGTVDITDHKARYGGGLIYVLIKDEITKEYEIIIDPRFAVLFGFGMWATLDKAQRRALGRNQTAKALHAFYSTHAAPGPHSFDTLAEIAGLKNSNRRDLKANIIKAHGELKRVGFLSGYEVPLCQDSCRLTVIGCVGRAEAGTAHL